MLLAEGAVPIAWQGVDTYAMPGQWIACFEEVSGTPKEQLATILDNHLKAIVSPFSRHLTSPAINLTPAELNVAHMVRVGRSTRQIADTLNVAYKTVETHRVNIRRKLGLTGKGRNLRTCLMAMEQPHKGIRDL